MPKFSSWILLALAATVHPVTANPTVLVTLSSVGDRVRSQNPDLAAARLRIEEATGRMTQSGRLANPEFETNLDHNPQAREARFSIGISQRFPITDRLRLEKNVSQTELKSAQAEYREVERQLVGRAREMVVTVLATYQRKELLREQSRITQEFSDSLSAAAKKGEGSALDAGQAKLEAASLAMEIRQLDAGVIPPVGELKTLLGILPAESLSVTGTLPEPTLPTRAVDPTSRPAFQMATLDSTAAEQGVALELAKRYDDVEGGFFTGVERTEDVPVGFQNEATVGLRLKIALPFWNKNEGAIHEAQAKHLRKQLEVAALSRSIHLAADTARSEMQEWAAMIREITDTLLPLAAEQAQLAEDAYREAQGQIQFVLRAREKRLQLAAARLDALRSFHLARVRYLTALGTP